jgi:hypothetical protein
VRIGSFICYLQSFVLLSSYLSLWSEWLEHIALT